MTRYALYFAPAADSPWWSAGCRWLGRDPIRGAEFPQKQIAGVPHLMLAKLTSDARRYGFHATLKAPFRLRAGFAESHLVTMLKAFCAKQQPITLNDMRVRSLGDFIALRPLGLIDDLGALANRCVSYFDPLRAELTEHELACHRDVGLTARQQALLKRWGYPYAGEEFRFHMTLTDPLSGVDMATVKAIRNAAEEQFAAARNSEPMVLDALTVFREDQPGAPFSLWRRFPFNAGADESALPPSGRLLYFVSPSGMDKERLLQWAKQRLPADADIVFAQRTITRPGHANEVHEATDESTFLQLAATGHFAMMWQANGLCYGVRRGIEADLMAGRDVIVSGAGEYVPHLQHTFPDAQVIWIDPEPAVRVQLRCCAENMA